MRSARGHVGRAFGGRAFLALAAQQIFDVVHPAVNARAVFQSGGDPVNALKSPDRVLAARTKQGA